MQMTFLQLALMEEAEAMLLLLLFNCPSGVAGGRGERKRERERERERCISERAGNRLGVDCGEASNVRSVSQCR